MKAVSVKTLIPGHRPDMLNMSGSSGKRVPGQLSHKGGRDPQQHRSRDHIIYPTSSGSQQCQAHNILSRTAMSLPPQRHSRKKAGKVTVHGETVSGNGKEPGRDDG
jgi:hypothetical protein